MAKRKGLIRFPQSVFEWSSAFGDDFGYEASRHPEPVDAPPGSPEKIAVIVERLSRGQVLWTEGDAVEVGDFVYDSLDYRPVGDERFGAVVGEDEEGHRHRYAIWKDFGGAGERLYYITETAGYRDSFEADAELAAIAAHARSRTASFVAVGSLFSARVNNRRELRDCRYPTTGLSMLWLRWLARQCDKSLVCWGDSAQEDRCIDVLWMLSRTSVGRHVYAVGLTDDGNPSPVIKRDGRSACQGGSIIRFDYKEIFAERESEEDDDGEGEDTAEDHRDGV